MILESPGCYSAGVDLIISDRICANEVGAEEIVDLRTAVEV